MELLQGTLDMLVLRTLIFGPLHAYGMALAISGSNRCAKFYRLTKTARKHSFARAGTAFAALRCQAADGESPTSTWLKLFPATSPTSRSGPGMAYDYETWAKRQPTYSPASFPSAQLFTDPKTGHVDLFTATPAGLSQAWQWNGLDWVLLAPANSPPARSEASAALDSATGEAILYGGVTFSNQPLTDTWAWDGADWTQLAPSTNPGS